VPPNGATSSSNGNTGSSGMATGSSMPSDADEAWLNRLSVKELRAELRIHGVVATEALVYFIYIRMLLTIHLPAHAHMYVHVCGDNK
jgi:hypothetical protein